MKPNDPAYWMLERGRNDPSQRSKKEIHRKGCYICEDEEFELMGMPLCKKCVRCEGHVPADDCICDDCDFDQAEYYLALHQESDS